MVLAISGFWGRNIGRVWRRRSLRYSGPLTAGDVWAGPFLIALLGGPGTCIIVEATPLLYHPHPKTRPEYDLSKSHLELMLGWDGIEGGTLEVYDYSLVPTCSKST